MDLAWADIFLAIRHIWERCVHPTLLPETLKCLWWRWSEETELVLLICRVYPESHQRGSPYRRQVTNHYPLTVYPRFLRAAPFMNYNQICTSYNCDMLTLNLPLCCSQEGCGLSSDSGLRRCQAGQTLWSEAPCLPQRPGCYRLDCPAQHLYCKRGRRLKVGLGSCHPQRAAQAESQGKHSLQIIAFTSKWQDFISIVLSAWAEASAHWSQILIKRLSIVYSLIAIV